MREIRRKTVFMQLSRKIAPIAQKAKRESLQAKESTFRLFAICPLRFWFDWVSQLTFVFISKRNKQQRNTPSRNNQASKRAKKRITQQLRNNNNAENSVSEFVLSASNKCAIEVSYDETDERFDERSFAADERTAKMTATIKGADNYAIARRAILFYFVAVFVRVALLCGCLCVSALACFLHALIGFCRLRLSKRRSQNKAIGLRQPN